MATVIDSSQGKSWDITSYVTGNNGWSTTKASALIVRSVNGTWRMAFNIRGTSSTTTNVTLTFSGITFGAFSSSQSCVTTSNSSTATWYAAANAGASTLYCVSGANSTDWSMSGDVELTGKPTFIP